ncbi:MAG: SatD family protein [Bacillota bacterium]
MYCAIIGDIVNSRKISNRSKAQEKLKKILSNLNSNYKNNIASKFTITLGDEFQGLLFNTNNLISIIDRIKIDFYPHIIRFGIGIGDINTKINKNISIGSDGPAYYAARKAIDDIKKVSKSYESPEQDIKIYKYKDYNNTKLQLINSNLVLCTYIENRWTDKQIEVIKLLKFENKSQREIAKEVQITQPSVQKRLNSSGYFTYKRSRDTVEKILIDIWEELDEN